MTKEEVAQWVIDERYPKGEYEKISDHELYHGLIEKIELVLQQNFCKPDVSGWLDFREQKPEDKQRMVIRNSKTGHEVIMEWSRLFAHLLDPNYDKWYPLPAIH